MTDSQPAGVGSPADLSSWGADWLVAKLRGPGCDALAEISGASAEATSTKPTTIVAMRLTRIPHVPIPLHGNKSDNAGPVPVASIGPEGMVAIPVRRVTPLGERFRCVDVVTQLSDEADKGVWRLLC